MILQKMIIILLCTGFIFDVLDHLALALKLNYYEKATSKILKARRYPRIPIDKTVHLRLDTFSKTFFIYLKQKASSFSRNSEFRYGKILFRNHHILQNLYHGHVRMEANSRVVGSIINGSFYGTIRLENETYFIDSPIFYNISEPYATLAYRDGDLTVTPLKFGSTSKFCQVTRNNTNSVNFTTLNSRRKRNWFFQEYTQNRCHIRLLIDPFFFGAISHNSGQSRLIDMVFYIIQYLETTLMMTNSIFSKQKYPLNVEFIFQVVQIISHIECNSAPRDIEYEYVCNSKIGSDKLLTSLKTFNSPRYCNFILLTYRTDEGRPLGNAHLSGVCSANFNTIIINPSNNRRLLRAKSTGFILSHELGHTFGSEHDDNWVECKDTKYIMSSVFESLKTSVVDFSRCSQISMKNLLNKKNRMSCFTDEQPVQCGDEIVEDVEECDCGRNHDCEAKFCLSGSCRLTSNAECSLYGRNRNCCNPITGKWYTLKDQVVCQEATPCETSRYCDVDNNTRTTICSKGNFTSDDTPCENQRKVCNNGKCSLSICSIFTEDHTFKQKQKFCIPEGNVSPSKECYIHCVVLGMCKEIGIGLSPLLKSRVPHSLGHPCHQNTSLCNGKGKCISLKGNMNSTKWLLFALRSCIYGKFIQAIKYKFYPVMLCMSLFVLGVVFYAFQTTEWVEIDEKYLLHLIKTLDRIRIQDSFQFDNIQILFIDCCRRKIARDINKQQPKIDIIKVSHLRHKFSLINNDFDVETYF